MFTQPISMLLSSLTLCGAVLAAIQVAFFSVTSPVSAFTASVELESPQIGNGGEFDKYLVTRATDGLFYIDGSINDVPIKFAIDTGASVVVLNSVDAERVNLKSQRPSTHRIRTAAGYSSMRWSQADALTIAGKKLGKIDVAIMESGPKVSLLGLNAISRLRAVTIKQDQLIIE